MFPDGSALQLESRVLAVQDEVFIRDVPNFGVALYRGPTHFSPDGEHCCVRTNTNQRICVTFTPCPTLSPLSNGMISYDATTNMATYTCNPGYAVATISSITCNDVTMQWSSTVRPTCELSTTTCSDLPAPTNGMIGYNAETMNTRPVNTVATFTCNTRYTVTGDMTRTCGAGGVWSGTNPTCTLVDCGPLTDPTNGMITLSTTTFGSTATYSCNSGHNLNGDTTRTCGANGDWSGSDPTCDIVDCGPLTDPTNGMVDTPTTTFESTATYSCNPGYQMTGLMVRTCTASGWSTGDDPVCTAVCLEQLTLVNGGISYNPTSFPRLEGAMATHSCNEGYTGGGTRTCLFNRMWSGSSLTCTLTCPDLLVPTNGAPLVYSHPTIPRAIDSTATYSCVTGCNPGYTRSGDQTRVCQASGEWSGSEPACNPVDCGPPLTINNGQVSTSPGTTFGSIATYTCNTGYTQNGPSTRTCQADTVWRGDAPTCDALCPREPLSNGMVTYSPSDDPPPPGAVATYSCNTSYELSGASTRNCVAVSGWSTSLPVCNPVNCGDLTDPSNGAVDTSSGTTFMMTATYTCNTGYTLIGANTRTCGGDGQWTPDAPTCLQLIAVITSSGGPMAGQSFSFTCSLSGGASLQPTLSYQWTREGGLLMTSTATLNFDTLYLSDAGQYNCQVILTSSQLEGEHTVAAHYTIEFMTLNIQLRLDGITNCEVYIESGRSAKASGITTRLSQGVEGLCACGFSPSLLTDEFINCFEGSSSHVTYRAVLTGTESVSTIQLARLMEQWVENDPIVVVQSAGLSVTNSCPIVIANLNSPECPEDITNRTQMATPTSSMATPTSFMATTTPTESVVVNVGTVAGWVVAGVLAIAVLVLIILLVLVMLRQRRSGSKDMSDKRTGSQPTQLPPVVMSHLPSHDYEGLSKLQEEATYEVVDQPRPPPPADYQLSACAAYASTDCNTENK
ncbi:sushi, von Willebrand factor type A, EGF and pentraxin domain-containing protein 1-like isoform X2 [Halichondria panicea]|uniref:sushi, von Willebrand factor type A, EGF and pentraxin domain-containing protein 1-like isoform X2 n=1 Tax=Halichondria panicea TaxID=6063 RepID=UPI00312B82D3